MCLQVRILGALVVTALVAPSAGLACQAQAFGPVDPQRIADRVREAMTEEAIPGVAIGIVVGDTLVFAEGFGTTSARDGVPTTANTMFQIGSVTKLFTVSLLMVLHERGDVRTTDPVADYLPEGILMPRDSGAPPITLRDLATHSAGLPQNPSNRRDIPNTPTVPEPYNSADLLAAIPTTRLLAPPGVYGHYSNFGLDLLGYALETSAAGTLEELMRRHLWNPLRMRHTFVHDSPAESMQWAAHHWPQDRPRIPREPWVIGEVWGAGGVSSNVIDLARFVAWQFHGGARGGPELSRSSQIAMHRPALPRANSITQSYGPGWLIDEVTGVGRLIQHSGDTDGHSAYVAGFVGDGIGIIVLANVGGTADEIGEVILTDIGKVLAEENARFREAFELGDWAALDTLAAVKLARNPWNDGASYFRGKALVKRDRCAEALPLLDRAGAAGRYRDYVEYYHATCHLRAGRIDEALERLQIAYDMGFREGQELLLDTEWASLADRSVVQQLLEYAH